LQQNIVAKFHEEWKGRIDPWQPKRKQRRKAARSTRTCNRQRQRGRDERPQSFLEAIASLQIGILNEAKDLLSSAAQDNGSFISLKDDNFV
jgi:hypothetical protein